MTGVWPIDAVPGGPDDHQAEELGLARHTFDHNIGGVALWDYLANFRRHVLVTNTAYERQWLTFCWLTWLHDGAKKFQWLINNFVYTARERLVLKHFLRARFVLLRQSPVDSIRFLVQVKQRLGTLVGLQLVPNPCTQAEEKVMAHRELLEEFEGCRALISADQLLELDYDDLIRQPLKASEGTYTHFGLTSWSDAWGPIKVRIDQAHAYVADPVRLPLHAERRLPTLMESS